MDLSAFLSGAVLAAIVSGIINIAGWWVTLRREETLRRQSTALEHLQHQIEDLYGPLYGLLEQSDTVYDKVAVEVLPHQPHARQINLSAFTPRDEEVWYFLYETQFRPIHQQIMELIRTKMHLLESNNLPDSFSRVLQHIAAFECFYALRKEKNIGLGFSFPGWPVEFNEDVRQSLRKLNKTYNEYRQHQSAIRQA